MNATQRQRWIAGVMCGAMLLVACSGDPEPDVTTTTPQAAATTTLADTTTSAVTAPPADPHPLDLTSEEICEVVSTTEVGLALDVEVDEAVPFEDSTPQCSYEFTVEPVGINNAIINVPTINLDLGGRTGEEAFDHVLSLYEDTGYTEAVTDSGDRSVVLSSPEDVEAGVHVGVIRLGERIVITIVSVGLIEYDALLELNELVAENLRP